jgi:hypothetical protein
MSEVSATFEPKTHLRTRLRAEAMSAPPRRYPAHVARQLALAHSLQRRVDSGEFADYAAMARALGFTRARVTQIMGLLLLAPSIQEDILFLEALPGRQPFTERAVREAVLKSLDWKKQRALWAKMARSLRD